MTDRWCILDDIFPNVLSAFRIAEYNAYLAASSGLTIFSTHPRLDDFKEVYAKLYPQFVNRIRPATDKEVSGYSFAYLMFLNNAHRFLRGLEYFQIPFAFTLYPGGGFGLNEAESDAKLDKVASSELLQGILTTQIVTEAYLEARIPRLRRDFVFGGVIHPTYFTVEHQAEAKRKPRYGQDKPMLDICFVAEKYMSGGANKGWPHFASAIPRLLAHPDVRLHIVGGFTQGDYPYGELPPERVFFHGHVITQNLRSLLLQMDAIISPNEPYKLHGGNFDGFPTGCCIEAALCGATLIVSDVLQMNPVYRDGKDIALIRPDAQSVVERALALAANPAQLAEVGEAGRCVTHEIFHPDVQIGRRKAFVAASAARVGVDVGFGI